MKNFLSDVLEHNAFNKFIKLEDKLYKIFLKEILCGRWSIGDRLPSYQELSKMSGVSRTPIQATLVRLENEGYIEKVERKGIFLKSNRLGRFHSIGTVVLLVSSKAELGVVKNKRTQSFGIWDIAVIERIIAKLGVNVHTLVYSTNNPSLEDDLTMFTKKEEFKGIISMVSSEELNTVLKNDKIPRVFLGVEDLISTPCLTGRPGRAMYLITKYLIERGHKNIALFISNIMNEKVIQKVLEGHKIAMQEAGLKVDNLAVEKSQAVKYLDVLAMRNYIEELSDATAIIGANLLVSQKIIETCDLMNINIPKDLSVCSLQACNMRGNSVEYITGVKYDWENIIASCLKMLLGAEKYEGIGHIEFEPIFTVENSVN